MAVFNKREVRQKPGFFENPGFLSALHLSEKRYISASYLNKDEMMTYAAAQTTNDQGMPTSIPAIAQPL